MSTAVRLALGGLARSPGRTALRVAVLAVATALLGAMLVYVGTSLRTMSAAAVRSVALDWQGPVSSYAADRRLARAVGAQVGVAQASPTATAPLAAASHSGPAGATSTGSGAVLAVPPDYGRHVSTFRLLHGSLRPGAVVLDQQMAATLQARIGDTVRLVPRRGAAPRAFRVSGVALVTAPDVVFAPLDPQLGPAPAQPPANAAILPIETFAGAYAPALRTLTPANLGSSVQPGAQDGVQWQVQAQLDARPLSAGSPADALRRADRLRNRVQSELAGRVQFVDNLSDALTTAAEDSLYAQALYIMLAVPGALVALGLGYLAALGAVERDRRELWLLRARGASRRDILAGAVAESVVIGVLAGVAGAAAGWAAVAGLVPQAAAPGGGRLAAAGAACVGLAIAGALAARLAVSRRALSAQGAEGEDARPGVHPLWQRLGLDFIALALSGLVYWLTARTGFAAVINPDANPTLSLSVYMFFAPALLWLGATMLLVRLRGRAVAWVAERAAGGRARSPRGFLLASASRRGAAVNRGLVLLGLLLAFGVQLAMFTATYDRQAQVDAQLTLGADVALSAPPGVVTSHRLAQRVASVPGVRATTAVDHSYAYVGPDLQDTYGIDPSSFARATSLRDSYFLGLSAHQAMRALARRRDGILVSKETIDDYSLHAGDLLRLRVLDRRSGAFRVVPFHLLGGVQEFPSAPRDSFMVVDGRYLDAASHAPGPNVVFARAAADPAAVGRRVAAATARDGTRVSDIAEQAAATTSSITTVSLGGISRIERAFLIVLACAAMALFVGLAVAERRRELAVMRALGAPLRAVAAFVWTETAIVLAAGAALGAGLGWLLATMLVAMLRHVFDPPPDSLVVPWGFLAVLVAGAAAGALLSGVAARRSLARLPLGEVLREQ